MATTPPTPILKAFYRGIRYDKYVLHIGLAANPVTVTLSNIRCVFLDRDGVINRKAPEGAYVSRWCDFHILSGVEFAIAALNRAGIRAIVISNQRGVALGYYTAADVDALHEHFQYHLAEYGAYIDAFYYCTHDKDKCNCRKPKIGLFEQAFCDFPGVTRTNSVIIGDSFSDVQAARNLGTQSILIYSGRSCDGERRAVFDNQRTTHVASSLGEAVKLLLDA